MLHSVRVKLSRYLWRLVRNMADGPQTSLGPIKIMFCFVNHNDAWIPRQLSAVKGAESLLTNDLAERFRKLVFDAVEEIIFCNTGHDKYEASEHRVFLRYAPEYTDNYIYLASRLVEIASLMETQYSGHPSAERVRAAREQQVAFLALFPDASPVKEWIIASRAIDGSE